MCCTALLSAWLFPKKWTGECSLAQLGVAGGVGCEPGMNGRYCGCPEICRSRLRPSVGLRLTAAVVSLQRVYIYQQPRGLATWAMLLIACMYATLA